MEKRSIEAVTLRVALGIVFVLDPEMASKEVPLSLEGHVAGEAREARRGTAYHVVSDVMLCE